MRKFLLVSLASLMFFVLAACGDKEDEAGTVIVSGKQYTEQIILSNIIGEYLKANTDLDVVMEDSLGSTFVLQQAMEKGEVDLYVEYTGTALEILKEEFDADMSTEEVYELARERYAEEYNVAWLDPLGFNNTYALAINSELYEELGIETYTELGKVSSDLSIGGTAEFMERDDGFDGLVETYDFEDFSDKITLDPDLMYEAASNGDVDIITAFATEAKVDQYDLKILEDDKNFFPPYDAGIVIRQEILDANPGLEDELNKLSGSLNDERMRELNSRVSADGIQDKEVALEFLRDEGFID